MPDSSERGFNMFSAPARRVFETAQEEAKRYNQRYITAEHLLLALLGEKEGIVAQVFTNLKVDVRELRTALEFSINREATPGERPPSLGPRAKKAIRLAVDEARLGELNRVGTEHLLIGLLRDGEGAAADLLVQNEVTLDRVRDETQKLETGTKRSRRKGADDKKRRTPMLDSMGVDLTELASDGKLDPVIGRDTELERVIQILSRRTKNNPVLVGDPGVGKTAIVEKLATTIVDGAVPDMLKGRRVVALDMGSLIAGTKYRGEFEERMTKIIAELKANQECILFIEEIHTLVGAGAAEGAVDAANILKPSLVRGELQVVGATTHDDYRKHIERDAALDRRFRPVKVEPPDVEETVKILHGVKKQYEDHHQLSIADEAIEIAAQLADRYIVDRHLPDKAIDLVDEAVSRVRVKNTMPPPEVRDSIRVLNDILREKNEAVTRQDYDAASDLFERETKQKAVIAKVEKKFAEFNKDNIKTEVGPDDVTEVVSMWTSIPVTRLDVVEVERLRNMEGELQKRVLGQEEPIGIVSKAVRRARAGFKDPKRPIGAFLFLGPTGVGKTHLVKQLAEYLFGDERLMIRLDMSEYMEKHTVSRLIGSPPGYVGYGDGGQLTEEVRKHPYSVILLDEIEKAHPDVFNTLLQVFEDGHLTDGQGRKIDFKNTIIVMTSNLGSNLISSGYRIGFGTGEISDGTSEDDYLRMRDRVLEELKNPRNGFKPEFLNRIDGVVVFRALGRGDVLNIVDLMMSEVAERAEEHEMSLRVSDAAKEYLAEVGFDPKMGARPLRRKIQDEVEDVISEMFLTKSILEGDIVLIDASEAEKSADRSIVITPDEEHRKILEETALAAQVDDEPVALPAG
ncbi:MAG: ATP-dependent Clp protease ATP-binding subunit [Chloroflexi bacterium]|nr:ATP-dependent Clp protease ATP-binding subunit [Chloroflexota bacterium]